MAGLGPPLLRLATQSPCMAGRGGPLACTPGCGRVYLLAPPAPVLSSCVLLGVSAPEPSDALPHTARRGLLLPLARSLGEGHGRGRWV